MTREDFTLKVYDELSPTTNTLVDDERASAERERRTRALKNLSAERDFTNTRTSSSSSSSHHRFIKHNAKEKHQREIYSPLSAFDSPNKERKKEICSSVVDGRTIMSMSITLQN